MGQSHSPSVVERDWLLRRREGLKRVRSLKLQLFCTLAGLVPSAPHSVTGDLRSFTDDVCLFLMLWPRGLASLTRSLKLNFWLESERGMNSGTEGELEWRDERSKLCCGEWDDRKAKITCDELSFRATTLIIQDFWQNAFSMHQLIM